MKIFPSHLRQKRFDVMTVTSCTEEIVSLTRESPVQEGLDVEKAGEKGSVWFLMYVTIPRHHVFDWGEMNGPFRARMTFVVTVLDISATASIIG